jgi:hypothetical protein
VKLGVCIYFLLRFVYLIGLDVHSLQIQIYCCRFKPIIVSLITHYTYHSACNQGLLLHVFHCMHATRCWRSHRDLCIVVLACAVCKKILKVRFEFHVKYGLYWTDVNQNWSRVLLGYDAVSEVHGASLSLDERQHGPMKRRHNPEEVDLNVRRRVNLKSRNQN